LEKSTPTVIIESDDESVIQMFRQASSLKGYKVLVEHEKLQAIWDTLDNIVVCFVIDLDVLGTESMAFINIIKKMRPRLPVVILSSEENQSSTKIMAEFGVFYRGIKPLCVQEVEHILEGVDSHLMRNRDYLSVSL
jgi:DNA-binding NtrC family response regulator